ncbi:MAG: SGNH/GDSL hydrolase family protein [Geminicoccaceae bacterium]
MSLASFLHRSTLACLAALLLAPMAARAATFDEMVVFGDSISDWEYNPYDVPEARAPFPYWSERVRMAGTVKSLRNYSRAGAFVQDRNIDPKKPENVHKTFKFQVDDWVGHGAPLKAKAVCAVYLGYNDIGAQNFAPLADLSKAKATYAREVDRLIAHGCTSGSRQLLLVRVHQLCRNPKNHNISCSRSITWNGYVDQVARARGAGKPGAHVREVDVYGRFEKIYAHPADYGYTNVTTFSQSAANSGSSILYWDGNHFGWLGHKSIAKAFLDVLKPL